MTLQKLIIFLTTAHYTNCWDVEYYQILLIADILKQWQNTSLLKTITSLWSIISPILHGLISEDEDIVYTRVS